MIYVQDPTQFFILYTTGQTGQQIFMLDYSNHTYSCKDVPLEVLLILLYLGGHIPQETILWHD